MIYSTIISKILEYWKIILPAVIVLSLALFLGGTRGCAKLSQAMERGSYAEVKQIFLSPDSDYNDLLLPNKPGK